MSGIDGRFTDKFCQSDRKAFRRTLVTCFSETTISAFGGWVLPKIFDISKGIFIEFSEKLQKSGVFRGMDEIFV